jgi:AcrR family transcriptional regulator
MAPPTTRETVTVGGSGKAPAAARRSIRRVQILRRAAHLFLKRGFEGTTLDDIAGALKLTKPALYYYFESKQELLAAIIHHSLDLLDEVREETIAQCPGHEDRLRRIIHKQTLGITRADDAAFGILYIEEAKSLLAKDRREITARQRIHFDFLRETLDGLKTEGRLYDVNTTVATFTLIGMVPWISKWYRPGTQLTPELVADEITKLVLQSVVKPK